MASHKRRIDIYFKVTSHGYETSVAVKNKSRQVTFSSSMHGTLSREGLVGYIFDYVKKANDPAAIVRIYPNGESHPEAKFHTVSQKTVAGIVDGSKSVEDLTIGKLSSTLELQLREAASRLIPTRRIPGSGGLIECPHCGRGVLLSVCQSCGEVINVITDRLRGPCVDLIEILVLNPEVDRLYVNQPWNPNPPWMSRVELFQMLREN